jgi:hypothetical protein
MHAHIEVKKDGKWLHYGCPDITRNYLIFACINGMRKEWFEDNPKVYERIQPVAKTDKLPDDMTEITRICLDMDRSDYRLKGYGVLDADDLYRLQKLLWSMPGVKSGATEYDLEESFFKTYIGGGAIAVARGFDDVRVIFWYDN